jgi:hypothetical protein
MAAGTKPARSSASKRRTTSQKTAGLKRSAAKVHGKGAGVQRWLGKTARNAFSRAARRNRPAARPR